MNFECIVEYENSSDKFDIGHFRIKVKASVGFQKFPYLPQYNLSGPIYNSFVVQAMKFGILGMYVH